MKAATKAIAPELNQEELKFVSGGNGNEYNLSLDDILKALLSPFRTIIKKIIGPHLPENFEVFYAVVQASMFIIEKMISEYSIFVWLAFQAYTVLPDAMKRIIWKAVYNSLKAEMKTV